MLLRSGEMGMTANDSWEVALGGSSSWYGLCPTLYRDDRTAARRVMVRCCQTKAVDVIED